VFFPATIQREDSITQLRYPVIAGITLALRNLGRTRAFPLSRSARNPIVVLCRKKQANRRRGRHPAVHYRGNRTQQSLLGPNKVYEARYRDFPSL
jgi:hypothetical protein